MAMGSLPIFFSSIGLLWALMISGFIHQYVALESRLTKGWRKRTPRSCRSSGGFTRWGLVKNTYFCKGRGDKHSFFLLLLLKKALFTGYTYRCSNNHKFHFTFAPAFVCFVGGSPICRESRERKKVSPASLPDSTGQFCWDVKLDPWRSGVGAGFWNDF